MRIIIIQKTKVYLTLKILLWNIKNIALVSSLWNIQLKTYDFLKTYAKFFKRGGEQGKVNLKD